MHSIKENSIFEYEIKKSKFITLLYRIQTIDEVNKYLENAKKSYKDATHYCFAYKLNNEQKFSDDGEPTGTAGLPIMDILNKKELDYILCIIVRYFGGIKLGAGGLIRAYSNAVREALNNNDIIELEEGYLISIVANYDEQKQLDYMFTNQIKKKDFNNQITYYLEIAKNDLALLKDYDYKIIENIMIEKD